MKIAFYQDKLGTEPTSIETTWDQLVDVLTNYIETSPCTLEPGPDQCKGKNCPHKSFSSIPDNPMAWSPVEIEGKRLDKNVKTIGALVLDFDHITSDVYRQIASNLNSWSHCKHTTHSHRDDDIAFRAVLELSRPVHANEWHQFLAAAVAYLKVPADPTCKNRSRFYYRPSHPKGAPHDAERVRGTTLDVDAILATAAPSLPKTERTQLPEERSWDLEGDAVVGAIGAAARYFPPTGRRNEFCMALAGMLRANGATDDDAHHIVYKVACEGKSENPADRAKVVIHTYSLPSDACMTGFTRLSEIIGEDEAKEIGDFLYDARTEKLEYLQNLDLKKQSNGANGAVHATFEVPPLPAAIDLAELRGALAELASRRGRSLERDSRIDAVVLRRALAGEPLARSEGAGDVETVFDEAEKGITPNAALRTLVNAFAAAVPLETPWEAVVEVVRLSITSTPDVTLDDAERAFNRAKKRRIERERERATETAEQRAAADATDPETIVAAEPPDGADWQKALIKGADGVPNGSGHNVYMFLRNHPDFCGFIRYNKALQQIEVQRGALKDEDDEDDLATAIEDRLAAVHGIVASRTVVEKRIKRVANKNAYDPVHDYLTGLKWDQKARLSNWLTDFCGVVGDDSAEARHARAVGKRWMIAAVARALRPGCKADTMLILESTTQGRGKSSAFRALGGDWFCETPIDVHSKDSRMLVGHNWIFEMAELQGFKTADFEHMKAFLSQQEDWVRVPYAKNSKKIGRRAIFGATTNRRQYLTDDTGNRRYWSVYVPGKIKVGALRKVRNQLFAEAVHLFLAAETCAMCAQLRLEDSEARCTEHRWWLTEEEETVAEQEIAKREEEMPWLTQIYEWWVNMRPHDRPSKFTCEDIAQHVLNVELSRIDSRLRKQVGNALVKLGFGNDRVMAGGSRHRFYFPNQELRDALQEKKVDRISKTLFSQTARTPAAPPLPVKN